MIIRLINIEFEIMLIEISEIITNKIPIKKNNYL